MVAVSSVIQNTHPEEEIREVSFSSMTYLQHAFMSKLDVEKKSTLEKKNRYVVQFFLSNFGGKNQQKNSSKEFFKL